MPTTAGFVGLGCGDGQKILCLALQPVPPNLAAVTAPAPVIGDHAEIPGQVVRKPTHRPPAAGRAVDQDQGPTGAGDIEGDAAAIG